MGIAILTIGPFAAAILTAGTLAKPVARASASTAVDRSSRALLLPLDTAVRETDPQILAPTPPPAPPPTPTPAPAPAPTPAAAHTTAHPAPAGQPGVAPPSASAAAGSVEAIIRAAASGAGVSGDWMVKIARCESGLNPRAYNPHGPYYGLFQFLASTFRANGGTNIWDPADQAQVAARMLAHGQAHQWTCA